MKKRKNTVPKPQTWLYVPVRWLCCLIARAAFGLRVTGRENLPQKGPLLVLATHQANGSVIVRDPNRKERLS